MKSARVIIVDDDHDVRESLQNWLSQDYITQSFDSAESFLAAIKDFEFEDGITTCLLLDFQMQGMTGVELQSELKKINVQFPIIFMSGNAGQSNIIDAFRGGAVDFVLKPYTATQISTALTELFKSTKLLQAPFTENKSTDQIPITTREAQVLWLLGKGYQQTEVAKTLGLSLRTIKMYRNFLKNKLNLNTLMELARYCDQHRLEIKKMAGDAIAEPDKKIN
jgi:FixJ family two-component response regulator